MSPPFSTFADSGQERRPSLAESYRTERVPTGKGRFWGKIGAFAGPGYMVAVGYMDPGNWATDLAGGSAFGYTLLSVILISNIMAMVLQSLSAKLGIVTGHDLAQACRARYGPVVNFSLWLLCELAIIACDLAEVLGTAIALQLLFGLPLVAGVCLTAFDVMLILALQRFGFRKLEAFIVALLIVIAGCFAFELAIAQPSLSGIAAGLIPQAQVITNPAMLYIAIGILGATVMPHNLYLHSSIVQTRKYEQNGVEKYTTEIVLQKYRGELTMLGGKSDGGGRSYDDDGGGSSFSSKAGAKRVSDGPRESFNQDLDDEIPF